MKSLETTMEMLQGKVKEVRPFTLCVNSNASNCAIYQIVFKSKASRVVQTIIKIGKDTHRGQIFDEIKGASQRWRGNIRVLLKKKKCITTDCILDLAKNHYGQFVLTKMLKYGSKEQRDYIISKFYGNVVKLTKHSVCWLYTASCLYLVLMYSLNYLTIGRSQGYRICVC